MRYRAQLTGGGSAEVAAYGIPDAEHALEKELLRACPAARLRIREVHRTDPGARIVEGFKLVYGIALDLEIDAEDETRAKRAAFAAARGALGETRFARVEWDQKVLLVPVTSLPPSVSEKPPVNPG